MLLLDEPTASLTSDEAQRLFTVMRALRDQGHAIVLVSHKLDEVFAICDTVTVLRDGRSVRRREPLADFGHDEIVDLMVGRAHAALELARTPVDRDAVPALELDNVGTADGHRDVSLTVRPGEIVGLYGLVGAGRSELARAVLGLDTITAGAVKIRGERARIRDVGEALRRYRMGYVTENRKEEGVFLEQPISRNIAVTVWRRLARFGLVRSRDENAPGLDLPGAPRHAPVRPRAAGRQLSGGNQQKVSLAKWLAARLEILIIDEPTVGIDVRTKAAFHELISEPRRRRPGHPADHQRPAGDGHAGRPDAGDAGLPDRRRGRQRPRLRHGQRAVIDLIHPQPRRRKVARPTTRPGRRRPPTAPRRPGSVHVPMYR